MRFGDIFKSNRKRLGLTQEEMATRLMVTSQAVSKWETGTGTPDISLLVPISKLFGITTDELLGNVSLEAEEIKVELDETMSLDVDLAFKYERYMEILKRNPSSQDTIVRIMGNIALQLTLQKSAMNDKEVNKLIENAEYLSKRLREIDPDSNYFTYSHAFLADVYMSASQYEKAEKEIGFLPYVRYGKARMMGRLREREKKYEDALEFYRESISDAVYWLFWDIQRINKCIWASTKDNTVPMIIFRLMYDIIHIMYPNTTYPMPLSAFLMDANIQLAAKYSREKCFQCAYKHLEEMVAVAESYYQNNGNCFDTGCILYPHAMSPFNKTGNKKSNYKEWILRCLSWNAFSSINQEERFKLLVERVERLL